MNFSVHLPQPLLVNLDSFAKVHNISRSSVVRDAVEAYLAQQTKSEWPLDMLAWMQEAQQAGFTAPIDDGPDFDALRRDANASWEDASQRRISELGQ